MTQQILLLLLGFLETLSHSPEQLYKKSDRSARENIWRSRCKDYIKKKSDLRLAFQFPPSRHQGCEQVILDPGVQPSHGLKTE